MGFNLDDYEPVEDRLRKFWADHPLGRIETELLDYGDGQYIVRAAIYRGDELRGGIPVATGLAQESVSQRGVNSTSALENCETSAIGRALANMNYAAKKQRPSREEMEKVNRAAGGRSHPAPPAADSPEDTYGEGVTEGQGTGGNGVSVDASNPPLPEPHDHVPGRILASGMALCVFELPNGTACGQRFQPKPTIFTAPIEETEVRADML